MSQKARSQALAPIPGPRTGMILQRPAVEAGKGYLAENTKRAYFRDWKDFFGVEDLVLVTQAMVLAVTPENVADFRDGLLARGLSHGTVNRKLTSVRAFFDQMVFRGVIALNPAHPKLVRSPKKGNVRKMEALDLEEGKAFLRAIDRSTPEGRRDFALIMFDLHMGLRRSEALSVRTEQFRVSQGQAFVVFRGKGEKERIVPVNRDLDAALQAYAADRGKQSGWVFPGRDPEKHLSGDMFWRIVRKYLKLANIRKKVGTHGLRATFISRNLAAGTPLDQIQKTVGHSRGETTLGYARDFEAMHSKATQAMEGFNAD